MGTAMAEELRVIDQLYEFILWTHNHIERFPRSVKFSIGSRIQDNQLEILQLLIRAKFSKQKEETLFDAGVRLEQVRLLFRMCKDMRLISLNSHEYSSRQLTDLTKQVQGWRRASLSGVVSHET
jgi:hypothetical protein